MPVDTVTSDVSSDNDSLVSVSEEEITSSSNESNISEHSSKNSSVISNTSTTKVNISESNVMESTCTINENISNTKNSNVNDIVSNSRNVEIADSLTHSGPNLVSPGSFSGGAEAPLSSVGVLDSAVRVSNVPSGLSLSKGSSSGVSKTAAARPSGLRPGLRKVISDCSLVARRKR